VLSLRQRGSHALGEQGAARPNGGRRMASSDHFRDKTAEDRPQASPRPTLSFGLAKRWVAKNGMDSPALILLPMIHPLRSATPLNSKAGSPRSADAHVRRPLHDQLCRLGWQKDGWQKMGWILLPIILRSFPPTPDRDSKAGHGARTPSSASLSMTDSAVGAGKKIGGKKQDHSPALILLPMIHPLRSATPFEYQDKISRST
jgi:hypothetical protein